MAACREQLRGVPDDRLLDLTGVRFVITDKQRDLWADDVYYDLELGARVEPGQELALDLSTYPPFPATALGVVAEAANDVPDGTRLAELIVTGADGHEETLDLRAGPATRAAPAPVRLRFADPLTPISLTVRVPAGAPDNPPARHQPDRRTNGRTQLGHRVAGRRLPAHPLGRRQDLRANRGAGSRLARSRHPAGRGRCSRRHSSALAQLGDPAFDPRAAVVLSDGSDPRPPARAAANESVQIVAYEPERVAITADVASPAVLVLADAFYPGWQATVDGVPAPILRANLMFRGLALAPGRHEIVFSYRPAAWRLGAAISLVALAALVAAVSATYVRRRRKP